MKSKNKRSLIIAPYAPISGSPNRLAVNEGYVRAIQKSRGEMLMLAVAPTKASVKEIVGCADGLLLTGGGDVEPKLYRERRKSFTVNVHPKRDLLECTMLEAAFERRMPVLAICRGMQMLNVFLGGTLWQDVALELPPPLRAVVHNHHGNPDRSFLAHEVMLRVGTELRTVVGERTICVNSLHHQGIRKLGKGLIPTAHSLDGLVEAVELETHPFFCVGVQWHPEELIADPIWQGLFDVFKDEARRYRASLA